MKKVKVSFIAVLVVFALINSMVMHLSIFATDQIVTICFRDVLIGGHVGLIDIGPTFNSSSTVRFGDNATYSAAFIPTGTSEPGFWPGRTGRLFFDSGSGVNIPSGEVNMSPGVISGPTDWSDFDFLNIRVFSARALPGATMNLIFDSNVPFLATGNLGVVRYRLNIDWENSWRVISIPLTTFEQSDQGVVVENAFIPNNTFNPWSDMSSIRFDMGGWVTSFVSGTEVFFDRMWLSRAEDVAIDATIVNNNAVVDILLVNDNDPGEYSEYYLFLALFNEDDKLVGIRKIEINEETFESEVRGIRFQNLTIEIDTNHDFEYVRVFRWDNLETMEPLDLNVTMMHFN